VIFGMIILRADQGLNIPSPPVCRQGHREMADGKDQGMLAQPLRR
jgi:hypothetical protein